MDYFKTLGINKNATDKEIKIAYRKLAKKYHPDTYKGDKIFAENKMKEINEAYDILSDEAKRRALIEEDYYAQQKNTADVHQNNYSTSNYETGSVYDFDSHMKQNYSRANAYYNYDYYVDENHSSNMYYVDFSKIKNNFVKGIKRAFLVFVVVVFVIIALIIFAVNSLFNSINNFFDSLKPSVSTSVIKDKNNSSTTRPEKSENLFLTEDEYKQKLEDLEKYLEENKEALEKGKEELSNMYNEWYNTTGKEYEAELNDFFNSLRQEF